MGNVWTMAAALAAAALAPLAAPAAAAPPQKPNIVVIISDDQGWKDVGFHGSDIKTPNIDALAAGGARLEQFYAQPMCSPTRAALMTGRYPFRYGLQIAIPSAHTYGLSTDERLLPQALKQAGYETDLIGKWHLGHADTKFWPLNRGFDHHYGPLLGEIDYFTHEQHGVLDWFRDGEPVKEPGYSTTLLGDAAVKLIEGHDPKTPLFLDLSFNAAHAPFQAPAADLERYASIAEPARRAYAAQVTAMDGEIGRVIKALDDKGLRDNTLILFQSDNGGTRNPMFSGEVDTSSLKSLPPDNGPYREGKGTVYEGGTRVVAIANWPGRIKPGTVVDEMIHEVDLYPTLVGLAGGSAAGGKPLDGLDVWGTISEGQKSPRTEIVYDLQPFRAGLRRGDWKLVWRTPLPQAVELYDIAKDPSEKDNVAAAHPDTVAALQARANALAKDMVPPLLLQTEFKAMKARMSLPPALPDDDAIDGAAE
ncbi:arylsulfatase A-like enzyme [Roseiarcus fermentans]|uniref:Arylsulfatase A-like enzyme n=1 Tax=Roseiarcus fermentans TaxID=1473586 RepID=A0A366FE17_9HYPH|nr:arylsulfatase [Roseiarcus fermentans]RBP12898.1 arylsulfatase A-like enzyme [Roseiarcus fermentans]